MKNRNRIITIVAVALVVVISICLGCYFYFQADRLTVEEKKWIDASSKSNQLININIINDANIFGNDGSGVFYSFLDGFASKYKLSINKVTYNYGTEAPGITLGAKTSVDKFDTVIYEDHYVLIL